MAPTVRRRARFFLLAVGLIGAAAAMANVAREPGQSSPSIALGRIPTVLPGWSSTDRVPAEVMPPDPSAETELVRAYQNGTQTVWVSVGYYTRQTQGRRPAARRLLFPGSGWTNLSEGSTRIVLDGPPAGAIPATQVVVEVDGRSVAILYWYQIGRHSIGSDHGYRALLLFNRLVRGRGDGALIRVASPVPSTQDVTPVIARQMEFVRLFYPELLRALQE
jgi:EpsI family protein